MGAIIIFIEVKLLSPIIAVTVIGTLAGIIGTSVGGWLCILSCNGGKKALSFLLAFSAGVMLAVVFVDLVPEAVGLGGICISLSGLLAGVLTLLLLDRYLPHLHVLSFGDGNGRHGRLLQSSLLLALGIAMHNFPEGLAIGASYSLSAASGLNLAVIIALHNIPEGMAIAGPMRGAGLAGDRIILWTCLAGAPTGIGALVGGLMGSVSSSMLSWALGAAAGAMLYISFDELLPEAQQLNEGSHAATFGAVAGTIIGLLLILLLPDI